MRGMEKRGKNKSNFQNPLDILQDWLRWPEDTPEWVKASPSLLLVLIFVGMWIASLFV